GLGPHVVAGVTESGRQDGRELAHQEGAVLGHRRSLRCSACPGTAARRRPATADPPATAPCASALPPPACGPGRPPPPAGRSRRRRRRRCPRRTLRENPQPPDAPF